MGGVRIEYFRCVGAGGKVRLWDGAICVGQFYSWDPRFSDATRRNLVDGYRRFGGIVSVPYARVRQSKINSSWTTWPGKVDTHLPAYVAWERRPKSQGGGSRSYNELYSCIPYFSADIRTCVSNIGAVYHLILTQMRISPVKPVYIQGVPGGMWNTSGECSLC